MIKMDHDALDRNLVQASVDGPGTSTAAVL